MIKLLIAESGSTTAAAAWNAVDTVAASRLLYPEARAALAAAVRAGRLDQRAGSGRRRTLEALWKQIDVVEATAPVAQSAGDLAETQGLRGYDAIHLASALALGVDVIVTADGALLSASQASGLAAIDARS